MSLTCMKAADIDKNLKMVDVLFHDYDRPDVPGASVMVIQNGKVLLAKSYGMADLENKIPAPRTLIIAWPR